MGRTPDSTFPRLCCRRGHLLVAGSVPSVERLALRDQAAQVGVSVRLIRLQCSERYRLRNAWTAARAPRPDGWCRGLAVHGVIEAWEQSRRTLAEADVRRIYEDRWSEELTKQQRIEPDVDRWMTGNSRVKGSTDVDRRHGRGWDQVVAYQALALDAEWEIWETPEDELAVELPFTITLAGVDVVGYIDQVREWPDGSLEVVDLKTGSKGRIGIFS
ncbi:PD-(D/E)XK nuclease family protein [Yinghuangia aomiensis]